MKSRSLMASSTEHAATFSTIWISRRVPSVCYLRRPNDSIAFATRILLCLYNYTKEHRELYSFQHYYLSYCSENHIWIVFIQSYRTLWSTYGAHKNVSVAARKWKYARMSNKTKMLWIILEMLSFRFSELRNGIFAFLSSSEYDFIKSQRSAAPSALTPNIFFLSFHQKIGRRFNSNVVISFSQSSFLSPTPVARHSCRISIQQTIIRFYLESGNSIFW